MTLPLEPIPSGSLPLAVRAPGKCILFGEHSVVLGGPEVVAAIDLFVQVGIRPRPAGPGPVPETNPYVREALARWWRDGTPLDLAVVSRVPKAAGLGSSAALCAGLVAGLGAAQGGLTRAELAARAFAVERGAQGVGSPGDTAASVAGGLVALNVDAGEELWSVAHGEQRWTVRRVPDPGWSWVVAHSGIPHDTASTVRAVGRRLAAPDGPALLERFRRVALDGLAAVGKEDPEATGRLLDENQRLLREVGVSHPKLEALLEAVRPAVYGAKLTGAGAGGSIVALPRPGRELEAQRRLARAGGQASVVRVETRGVCLVDRPTTVERAGSLPGDDPDDGAVR